MVSRDNRKFSFLLLTPASPVLSWRRMKQPKTKHQLQLARVSMLDETAPTMRAIAVKFLPWTESKPSRLKAYSGQGRGRVSLTASKDGLELAPDFRHSPECTLAMRLARQFGWSGQLVSGTLPNGEAVFVFAP